jgi:hypothetical protein
MRLREEREKTSESPLSDGFFIAKKAFVCQ